MKWAEISKNYSSFQWCFSYDAWVNIFTDSLQRGPVCFPDPWHAAVQRKWLSTYLALSFALSMHIIFSLHIPSCDLPHHTDSMRQNTGQQTQLTYSQEWKSSVENANSWVGCLGITFPDEKGKQFTIKISSFCALSMIIISASRNPQSNLQCVFSEYHLKK